MQDGKPETETLEGIFLIKNSSFSVYRNGKEFKL